MKERLQFLLAAFFSWLPLLTIQKPLFMLYNHELATDISTLDYLRVMVYGLKLDCTIAGYLTVIPFLCTLLSVWAPIELLKKVLRGYYFVISLAVAAIFAVDLGLYEYWQFRLDATPFFYIKSPKDAFASVPLGAFFLLLGVFLVYAHIIFWSFNKYIIPLLRDISAKKKILCTFAFLLMGGILFIPIRGGVTTSTANVGMVYFSNNQFLNHSAINPCFSLIASLTKQQNFASQFKFFPEEKRKELFESLIRPNNTTDDLSENEKLLNTDRPNILIILLESFSANIQKDLKEGIDATPNLNKLGNEGVAFTNMYASSFRTDRGIVAVLNGYLSQPTTSIMKYPAKSQTLPSIAKSLATEGYTSDILYGGDINFSNMQSYFFSSGYSKITADTDFHISSRLNKWGANDDITFIRLLDIIKNKDEKSHWLTTFLTLSSHEPFEVPYKRFKNPYLNSVAFTDSCLGDFIDKFKKIPAWNNSLIILLSDHGFRYPENLKEYEPDRFHIPMIWTGGAVKESKVIDRYTSQTDLAATLLSQLGLSYFDFTFSRNILSSDYNPYAYYTFSNGFGFIDSTGVSVFDNDSNLPLMEEGTGSSSRLDKGKALLQTLYDDLGNR